MERWLDETARDLASGVSRREVLKRAGGVLAAGLLAALLPGQALAKPKDKGGNTLGGGNSNKTKTKKGKGGNSACAHWCQQLSGKARGKCVSAAAKGGGICYECGPGAGNPANSALCGGICVTGPTDSTVTCTNGVAEITCTDSTKTYCSATNTCVDTSSDVNNCGGCGTVCPEVEHASPVCTTGVCGFVCDDGYTESGGACIPVV